MDVVTLNQQISAQVAALEAAITKKEAELEELNNKLLTLKEASKAVISVVQKLDEVSKILREVSPQEKVKRAKSSPFKPTVLKIKLSHAISGS